MDNTFSNRCRACAVPICSEKMLSLFENSLDDMFTHCTSIEISSNDSLPSSICPECFDKLTDLNKFRQSCAESDAYFREQIFLESIKVEPRTDVDIKFERNAVNQDLESDFFQIEYIDKCDTDLSSPNTLAPNEDTDSAKFICDYCGKHFNQRNHIAAHMSTHFPVRLKKTLSLKNHRLKIHNLESQPGAKPATETLKCPQCPMSFQIHVKLDAHIRSFHYGLKAYKCEQCEKEYCSYRSLCRHLQCRHATDETEIEKHYCPHDGCDRSYVRRDTLKSHIDQVHLGIRKPVKRRRLICDQCGRSFCNGFELKEHGYSHSGATPFACKICPKKFISNLKLKVHAKRHLKLHECPTCGRRFSTNKGLAAHVNFHTKEITYSCKECPRVFPSYVTMNRHVRIRHRNLKPYVCTHCQRAFTTIEMMRNHVMTHTGEKPFACSVCGHRFIQKVALKTHMKVHAKK